MDRVVRSPVRIYAGVSGRVENRGRNLQCGDGSTAWLQARLTRSKAIGIFIKKIIRRNIANYPKRNKIRWVEGKWNGNCD